MCSNAIKLFNRHIRPATIVTAVTVLLTVAAEGAELIGPVTGGMKGVPFSAPAFDVATHGYVVEEYFIEGDAHAYEFAEGTEQTPDGRWSTRRRATTAPYKSRFLVVRPKSDADFNGTVIAHWQNVTAGYELGSVTEGEYLRGYAWVGVSAQKIGIDGFPGPAAAGLKQWDEERYGTLDHPGDAYSYDIFAQAGRAIGPDRPRSGIDPMGGLDVKRVVAAGASQSAGRLRTYINGVHPVEKVYDGFIPYIDFGSTIPFDADFAQTGRRQRHSTIIRTDIEAPVIVVNSETETAAYVSARQPDSDTFRFWEVAGTSHVSAPRGEAPPGLDSPNWLAYQPVYSASLRHMHRWLADDVPPPRMPRIEVNDTEPPTIVRDEHGNARGGIRLPGFAVPTASHAGRGKPVPGGNRFAFLYGAAEDFSAEKLAALYPTRDRFLERYDKEMARCVEEGMILPEDAPGIRKTAQEWSTILD